MAQLSDSQFSSLLHAVDVIGAAADGRDATWDNKPIQFMTKLNGLDAKVGTMQAASAPTQDQVDAAILKAMQDPTVLKGIGDAIASHLHIG